MSRYWVYVLISLLFLASMVVADSSPCTIDSFSAPVDQYFNDIQIAGPYFSVGYTNQFKSVIVYQLYSDSYVSPIFDITDNICLTAGISGKSGRYALGEGILAVNCYDYNVNIIVIYNFIMGDIISTINVETHYIGIFLDKVNNILVLVYQNHTLSYNINSRHLIHSFTFPTYGNIRGFAYDNGNIGLMFSDHISVYSMISGTLLMKHICRDNSYSECNGITIKDDLLAYIVTDRLYSRTDAYIIPIINGTRILVGNDYFDPIFPGETIMQIFGNRLFVGDQSYGNNMGIVYNYIITTEVGYQYGIYPPYNRESIEVFGAFFGAIGNIIIIAGRSGGISFNRIYIINLNCVLTNMAPASSLDWIML